MQVVVAQQRLDAPVAFRLQPLQVAQGLQRSGAAVDQVAHEQDAGIPTGIDGNLVDQEPGFMRAALQVANHISSHGAFRIYTAEPKALILSAIAQYPRSFSVHDEMAGRQAIPVQSDRDCRPGKLGAGASTPCPILEP
jgi:hypothetical protein